MVYHVQFPGLGLEFTVNRVALSIGGFNIYWYGVIIAVGMLLALLYAFRNAVDFGIDSDRLVDVVAIGTVMSQCIAAFLTVRCLVKTDDHYGLKLRRLRIVKHKLFRILRVGIPTSSDTYAFRSTASRSSLRAISSATSTPASAAILLTRG